MWLSANGSQFAILMGINHLPSLGNYWKCDEVYNYCPVLVQISRDRFFDIARYLYFVDNQSQPQLNDQNYNRLQKVQPVIKVHPETALRWLYELGFSQVHHQKEVYFDGHDRADVAYRNNFWLRWRSLTRSPSIMMAKPWKWKKVNNH